MDACFHCWSRYMEALALSRHISDRAMRTVLIREAYVWLQRYFEAEERELRRRQALWPEILGRLPASMARKPIR